jgi:DNA-binding NtrC family response regulator
MPLSILIVEDEALSRRNLAAFLEYAGYEVHQAETGEAALDLLSRVDFDVVISDFRLPGPVNGLDVLANHGEISPEKQKILITAFGSQQTQSQAKSVGALYIEKPISLNDLLLQIQKTP